MLGYSIASRAIADHPLSSIKNIGSDNNEAQETIAILPIYDDGRILCHNHEQNNIKPTRG